MALIGNLTIGTRLNSKGLKKGADESKSILQSIGKQVSVLNTALAGIGAAVGIGFLVKGFTELTKSQIDSVSATTRLADRIGTTTEALSGLQYVARQALGTSDIEGFGDALSDMQEKIGDVTLEEGGAKDIMAQLGLDAESMKNADAVTNFKAISDAISGVESKAEKLHIADTLFGGEGQKMLPLLEMGSEKIEEMQSQAKAMGLTFDEFSGGQVVTAQKAIASLTERFTGLSNQIVVQLAPYITGLIEQMQQFSGTGVSATEAVSTGIGWLASGLGLVSDIVDVVMDAFQAFRSGVTRIIAGITSGIAGLIRGVEYLSNALSGAESNYGEYAQAIADDLHQLADEQWDDALNSFAKAPPSEGISQFFANVQKSSEEARKSLAQMPATMQSVADTTLSLSKSISDLESSLKDQIATFGMSSSEAEIYKLSLAGATEEQLASIRAMTDQLAAREKLKSLQDEAKSIIEASKTPLEQYQAQIEKLNTLRDQGLLNTDQYDRAVKKAGEGLGNTDTAQPPKFAALAELGSQEARDTILRTRFGNESDNSKEDIKVAKQSLDQLKQLPGLLTTIASKITSKPEQIFSF